MWIILILSVLTITTFIYWKLKQPHYYWTKLGVKQENPPFLLGNTGGVILKTTSLAEVVHRMYKAYPEERYIGIYTFLKPTLFIKDPDLLKQIMVKEFDSFSDHTEMIPSGIDEIWSRNLFASKGEKWHGMRSTLSPAFTSSKMRSMFMLMSDCAEQFVNYFLNKNDEHITLEMEDAFTRFSNDVIATCAFGLNCDSLKEQNNEFYLYGKEILDFSSLFKNLGIFLYRILPGLMKACGVKMFTQRTIDYFGGIIRDTIKTREENKIIRPDMIHLLREAQKGRLQYIEDEKTAKEVGFATAEESDFRRIVKSKKLDITELDIIAQAMLFFFAGFETTSLTLCMMAYEMALNPDVQDRLINEIDEHLQETNGKISYEGIHKLRYLDMVISEVLRKWPPIPITNRLCIKPFTIDPVLPTERPVHLSPGTPCDIPIFGIHRDPKNYSNPDKFDPERFNEENRKRIHPCTFLPFGGGPRNCIGSRFALIEAKTIYVHVLRHFKFVPVQRTQIPFKISPLQFNIHAEKGNWLGLQRRN